MLQGENCQVRIEVEGNPKSLLIVLDRRTDCLLVSWQDAQQLARTLDCAISDIKDDADLADPAREIRESSQVRLAHKGGLVALVFDWTDRIRLGWRAAVLVRAALEKVAQDAHLEEEKAVHLVYNRRGEIKKLFNRRTGLTQHIPGR